MDPTVLAALIAGISAIIAALIAALGSRGLISLFEIFRRPERKISSRREITVIDPTKPDSAEILELAIEVPLQQPAPTSKRKSKILVIRILLPVVIGGIIGGVLGYSFIAVPVALSPCGPFAPTSVTITSPTSDSGVPSQIAVQGTACHIPPDKELWLLVQKSGVSGYFPQPGHIVVSSDGIWSTLAIIGSDTDSGITFTLIPALVNQNDKEAKDAIQMYFNQPGPVYLPLEPLPSGIQLISQVQVIRK